MENQQKLPTILSKAINLKRQTNLNTTKTNLPTTTVRHKTKKEGKHINNVDNQLDATITVY